MSDICEINLELLIHFCEMIINESKYEQLQPDVKNVKIIAGIK